MIIPGPGPDRSCGFAALRLVDNKAILYFDAPSPSDALNWYRGEPARPP